jgi:diguanylate cyclase (GGDEF)-like protein
MWGYLTASLVRTPDGAPSHLVAVVEDLTERVQLRTRLEHQTHHDQLTRLPNRSSTEERLRWMFSETSPVRRVGLCALNLDGFRAVNDSLGHGVGDRLLLAVASRLQMAVEGGHLITRTGGDEFAILVEDPSSVTDLSEIADAVLRSLQRPIVVGAHELRVSACIGIAMADVEDSRPAELTRSADVALSWAKAEGRGRWCLFDPERDAGVAHRFALMARMPSAVNRDEFRLVYQPLVCLADGRLTGVEALVRWQHPHWGMLRPSRFIELAERSGTILALGRWVLEQACLQGKQWAVEFGEAAPYVSVNVAPQQLTEPSLVTDVVQVLRDTGLEPHRLQLEITERAVIDKESGALDALDALRQLGIRLAIDDFGTGYSSLSYLSLFPWDVLKIDGSFIERLRTADAVDPRADKIVEALISMAHALGLEVTAEWVETRAQCERLAALGCETGQGRLFGDAVPAAEVEALLRG